ncbi:ABC transporter permease protein YxdM [Ktedonobacter sp. SOSP1-52]|uniref:FtsX-like permease family protein n=1 Tax=Ktedonobacter sp. SOSP1-52 TaxID=2778366 RepID=UPI00191636AE|nr:ABC transporter permease [Ktedonobacter sp. SOSP1-52]GHO68781.1 ABC transporter permease protein YxdM [Ktedonobacter sp. SOSP1-52]
MTFFQFASNNVRRNGRAYAAYFLSSVFAILMFFLYATLANHPVLLTKGYVDPRVIAGMQGAEYIIFVFAFFFILYSMSSFLRGRNKEFGILTLLGISNQQLTWLIFLENIVLGIATILVSIVVGLLFSQLFLMLGSMILDTPTLPFYVPIQALQVTCSAFIVLFFLGSIATIFFIRHNTVLALLKGSQRPKREPKISILFALLGFALLVTGYVIALTFQNNGNQHPVQPILVVILSTIGTYVLYSQGNVFLIQILKKRRSYYWRGTNMLWLSELAYNMKDNARLLFIVAMILSVAFSSTGILAVFRPEERASANAPFTFTLAFGQRNSQSAQPSQDVLNHALAAKHFTYTTVSVPFITLQAKEGVSAYVLMSMTSYNRLAECAHVPLLSVHTGEAIALDPPKSIRPTDTLSLRESKKRLHLVAAKAPIALNDSSTNGSPLIVTDLAFQELSQHTQQGLYVGYNLSDWRMTTDLARNVQNTLNASIPSGKPLGLDRFVFTSHAWTYFNRYQLPRVAQFIGLFTALIFLIASGSFLYFRLYTILTENKEQYRAIAKVGLTESEMQKSVTIQVAILFFAPFLMAVLNTVFAMLAFKNNINPQAGSRVLLALVETIGLFLTIQLAYFLIIRMQYLSQLRQALV